jgi:hypothetical protein
VNSYTATRPPVNGAAPQEQQRELVLAWLRCLDARTGMFKNEIRYIGVSLKAGLVTPDDAVEWLRELDPVFLGLVEADR